MGFIGITVADIVEALAHFQIIQLCRSLQDLEDSRFDVEQRDAFALFVESVHEIADRLQQT